MKSALLTRSLAHTAVESLWKRKGECMYVRNEHGGRQKGVSVSKGKEKEETRTIGSTAISSINDDGVKVGTPESYRNCRCTTARHRN